jgi:TonB-linked SusC/RagA family outer membrane protein
MLWAQDMKQIKGTVTSAKDGEVLIGASVYVPKDELARLKAEGKQFAGITNIDGIFSIKVPKSAKKITISFIGYKTQEVDIQGKTEVKVKLAEDAEQIEEVVVTGYGKITKNKYTGSVTTVKLDEIEQAGVASIENMLEGKLAGVQTTVATGAPGSSAKITIRGVSSFSGNTSPLWVVDGVPIDAPDLPDFDDDNVDVDDLSNTSIGGLNPQDIAGITVLKDAAATSIYGARAANGVIVVTTKRGKKGKMKVSFSANNTISLRPNYDKLNLLNANEKVQLELDILNNPGYNYYANRGSVATLLSKNSETEVYRAFGESKLLDETRKSLNDLRNTNTDWEKELFQVARNQDYSLSLSGGNDDATYYVSGGYHKEEGTVKKTGLERVNLTMKGLFKLTDKLNIGVSTFINNRTTDSYLTQAGSYTNPTQYARTVNPYQKLTDSKGEYIYDQNIKTSQGNRIVDYNILEERNNTSHELDALNVNAIFDLDYKFTDNLKLTSQVGIQKERTVTTKEAKEDSYFMRDAYLKSETSIAQYEDDFNNGKHGWWNKHKRSEDEDGYFFFFLPEGGYHEEIHTDFYQYNIKNMLHFNKTFNDIHDLSVMVGSEIRKNTSESNQNKQYGYNFQTLESLPVVMPSGKAPSSTFKPSAKTFSENAYVSYFSTASYTYNSKYTLFASLRYDGSNLFGVDARDKFTPIWSISGTWRVSQEDFLRDNPFVRDVKLRASFGFQGNVDKSTKPVFVGEYKYVNILSGRYPIINMTSLPNPNLSWEKTKTYNFGLDFAVLNNRLRASMDYYYRYGTDLIELRQIPLENGEGFTSANWAEMSNKGFELSLSSLNIDKKDFKWTTSFNLSKNTNEVEKQNQRDDSVFPSKVGHSVNSFFVLKTAGYDANGYMQYYNNKGEVVSGLDFLKPNGNDVTVEQMRDMLTYGGTTDPDFNGGIVNKFKYKNYELSISANFTIGQKAIESPDYTITEFYKGQNYNSDILNRWSKSNTSARLPRILMSNSNDNVETSNYNMYNLGVAGIDPMRYWDIWVKEMNYIRISNIRFGYNMPKSITKRLGIDRMKVTLEARNMFVISSNYDGYFDPETYGNRYAQPIPKSFSLGVNLGF